MTDDIPLSKSDRTSNAILDSAYNLICSQGYAATSMRQIADGAGLALGSIYNHFSSKEEIFEAILQKRHPFFQIMPLLVVGCIWYLTVTTILTIGQYYLEAYFGKGFGQAETEAAEKRTLKREARRV